MQELEPLIKAVTNLVNLYTMYLLIVWGHQALQYIGSLFR